MDAVRKKKIEEEIKKLLQKKIYCKLQNKACLEWFCNKLLLDTDETNRVLSGELIVDDENIQIFDIKLYNDIGNKVNVLLCKWRYQRRFKTKSRLFTELNRPDISIEQIIPQFDASYEFNNETGELEVNLVDGIRFQFEIEVFEQEPYEMDPDC